jgi:hypothetical protein
MGHLFTPYVSFRFRRYLRQENGKYAQYIIFLTHLLSICKETTAIVMMIKGKEKKKESQR